MNNMISDTIWNDAIEAGRKTDSCITAYSKCMPDNVEHFAKKIQKNAKPKK
jgi:hypothetical protein